MEITHVFPLEARTPFIVWTHDFSVGNAEVDDHHRTVISLLNDLYDACREGSAGDVVAGIVERLCDYTRFHFSREEELMEEGDYPELEKHRMIHRLMTRKSAELREHAFRHGTEYTDEVFSFLKNWWTCHILQLDRHYAPFVAGREA